MSDIKMQRAWGDIEDSDPTDKIAELKLSSSSSTAGLGPGALNGNTTSSKVNADGLKTVVEYYSNERGQKVKVTRTVKVIKKSIRVNKNVAERRKWKKFGDCSGLPPGPEENVTYTSGELIKLDLRPKKREQDAKDDDPLLRLAGASIVVCRTCGEEGHWTLKCPKRNNLMPANTLLGSTDSGFDSPSSGATLGSGGSSTGLGSNKYIPIQKRAGASATAGGTYYHDGREEATLRVTNLSEDTTEADLSYLFRTFGHTSRIYLAKDRLTNKSRGFAFINYTHREDAQAAIDKLNGYGYDNLILQVEWAKPREDKPRTEQNNPASSRPRPLSHIGPERDRSDRDRLDRDRPSSRPAASVSSSRDRY